MASGITDKYWMTAFVPEAGKILNHLFFMKMGLRQIISSMNQLKLIIPRQDLINLDYL